MADNVFLCLKCGEWFPTKVDLKDHTCERYINRDKKVVRGKDFHKPDPDKDIKRTLGNRLKELGEITNRNKLNFMKVEDIEKWLEEAEQKHRIEQSKII